MGWFIQLNFLLQLLLLYFIAINVITFFYFGIDKMIAIARRGRRVPEMVLWILMGLGGTIGALLGMHFFRHKTQKASFQTIVILIMLMQVSGIIFLIYWFG